MLPGALAAAGAYSLLRSAPSADFQPSPAAFAALPVSGRVASGGPAFGLAPRRPSASGAAGSSSLRRLPAFTERAAGNAAAVLEREEASTYAGPSVATLAFQALTFLAISGASIFASFGTQAAAKAVVGMAGMYVIMSCNEYVVHRYYQHLGINKLAIVRWLRSKFNMRAMKTSGHIEHHKETLDDMSLDIKPEPILDADPFRGTAFSWSVSAMMTFEIAIQSYPFLWLCGWSFKASTIALAAAMFLHAAVWQTLHPNMHELPDPPVSYGVPGWSMKFLRNSGYFKFLYMNHEGHHRAPGAHGNYNVCFPLADHLFGTYVGIIPPKEPQLQAA